MASVRHRYTPGNAGRPADLVPGEIVWANIINGVEDPRATGKSRPVILVEQHGSAWKTLGLTTNPCHRDGAPRVSIPNHHAVGLKRPGWLWGGRLCWTSGIDVGDHIGWTDLNLAFEVIKLADLDGWIAKDLLATAREHHGPQVRPELHIVTGGTQ